jgi:AraC-like DNA-binding protein
LPANPIALRRVLLDRLAGIGVDVSGVLGRAGLTRSRFQSAKASLTTREFFAFWRAVEELAGTPDLGLRLGSDAQLHHLDVGSLAALHSPNLGEALATLARYKRLCSPEEVRIEAEAGEARIWLHWLHADQSVPMMLIDATFARILAVAHLGTAKPLTPLRVELARRRSGEAMLKEHFACDVSFDAPADMLVLDVAALACPFLKRNADLYDVLLPELEASLREHRGSSTLVEDVKSVLQRSMCGERPSVEKVAEVMHVSPRTLQRRLTQQQTTYQRLLDDVRDKTARRLLLNTDLDASEIAFLLGFDELNSFTRAFYGWQGATPVRWRQRQRDERGTGYDVRLLRRQHETAGRVAGAAAGRGRPAS